MSYYKTEGASTRTTEMLTSVDSINDKRYNTITTCSVLETL